MPDCDPSQRAGASRVQANEPELLAHLIGVAQFYEASESQLPDDLREDFDTLLEPYDAYWSAVSLDVGGATPPPEFLQPVLDDIDHPEFLAAATRINTWANTDC